LIHFPAVSPEQLGQHFLADASWRAEIADTIHVRGGLWLEIGAGHGEMTSHLSERADRVVAIELDPRLAAGLRKTSSKLGNVDIVEGDVLALDLKQLTGNARFSVYGNLPYYITSPILHRLFEHAQRIHFIHILIQLEVAQRIVAAPGSRDYGYLSVVSQWYSRPELSLHVPPAAFDPPPKVESALVSLRMPGERVNFGIQQERIFLDFVKKCFAQKRKTLRNNLRAHLGKSAEEVLVRAGLPGNARAEELSVPEFVSLFQLVK
jgi:16S rRNA (adenine1518-N6/adenine1519-N6)-dimethyltransferase